MFNAKKSWNSLNVPQPMLKNMKAEMRKMQTETTEIKILVNKKLTVRPHQQIQNCCGWNH